MTHKILKIIFILSLIFSFCISYVYATDINLNLPNTDDDSVDNITTSNQEQENTDNTITDEQNTENIETTENEEINENNENIDDEENTSDDQADDTAPTLDFGEGETLQASDISTVPENGLGITNIINILLITVGVIIILLAIAIMIRLKN